MTGVRLARRATVMAAVVVALAGCSSQIAALAPVGGDDITAVRNAAIDVVAGHNLLIKVTPRCTDAGEAFSCVGSLTDGSPILVSAPADGTTLTVTVGGRVLYDGSVQAVLDAAAQGQPIPAAGAGGTGPVG